METIEITMAEFKELHKKAVMYDLLKKVYDSSKYHTELETAIFAEKEISLDFIGGDNNESI